MSNIGSTEARDLQANLTTLQANLAFRELAEMRASNPNGAGLGNITERELDLLGATMGSLDQAQTVGQLKRNLTTISDIYSKFDKAMIRDLEDKLLEDEQEPFLSPGNKKTILDIIKSEEPEAVRPQTPDAGLTPGAVNYLKSIGEM